MSRGISVNIRLKSDILGRAKAEADRLGLSFSAFVTMCLASYIDGIKFEREKTKVASQEQKIPYAGRVG